MSTYPLRMLGEEKSVSALEPGDILLGFHSEPIAVVAGPPEDGKKLYPNHEYSEEYWYLPVRRVDPLGIRPEVEDVNAYAKDGIVRVGTVPLKRVKDSMLEWEKPDGTRVEWI